MKTNLSLGVLVLSLPLAACGGSSATSTPDGGGGAPSCTFGEPNNTRETATPVELNHVYAGVCVDGTGDPTDFYEVTAPSTDAAGGVVQVQVRNVQGQSVEFQAYASDNNMIMDVYTTTPGGNVDGWFTVAPGAKYRVEVHMFAGESPQFKYDINFKYTALVDAFEPNDSKATAKPITVVTAIQASAACAAEGVDCADTEKDDWYAVTLAAGTATVLVSNVPDDTTCDLTVYDPAGTQVDEKYSTTEGGNCMLALTDLTAGSYKLSVQRFAGTPPRQDGKATLPAFVTGQYSLLVSQP